jgi:uncharacterized protein
MIIEETFTIEAPLQKVWDHFMNTEQLAKCMPGAEVRQTDADNFEGELKVKIGPLGGSFGGSVNITSKSPPTSFAATVKAKDKGTGSIVQGEFTSSLKRLEPGLTEVSYKIDVAIRGKMGQFGQTVIQDTAKRLSAEFLGCVKAQIETPEGKGSRSPTARRAVGVAIVAFVGAVLTAIRAWLGRRVGRKSR